MRMNSRSIVSAHFEVSRSTIPSSHDGGISVKRNGVEAASWEVRTDGAKNDEAFSVFWWLGFLW